MNRALMSAALLSGLSLVACSKKEAPPPVEPPAAAAPVAAAPTEPAASALPPEALAIQGYVDQVELEFREKYDKKEVALTPELLKGVTDAPWARMHVYSDQGAIKRIKLYPAGEATKVEEFYFRDGQLAYVSDEPSGSEQAREQYFFSAGQLIAAVEADGKLATLDDAEKLKGTKLVAESQAFLKLAGS